MPARLELDAVWVLVSPGNPLKNHGDLAPLTDRVESARNLMEIGRSRSAVLRPRTAFGIPIETIQYLKTALPDRRFVWIMGADNLASFHKWERWQEIARLLPIAVYVRPGSSRLAPASLASTALSRFRVDESMPAHWHSYDAPAWVYLHGLMSPLSSSAIRARQNASN